jgi:hypothetical protein
LTVASSAVSEPLPGPRPESPPDMAGWNLALRFGVELGALVGLGAGGWSLGGALGGVLAVVLPLVGAVAWGALNVEGDPSRSGRAPVPVPGAVRLAVEAAVFIGGAAGWFAAGYAWVGATVVAAAVLTTAASLPRVSWLLAR